MFQTMKMVLRTVVSAAGAGVVPKGCCVFVTQAVEALCAAEKADSVVRTLPRST